MMPSARSVDDDRRLRDLRKDNKITAILHTGYPVRHWDNDLGPGEPHLFGIDLDGGEPRDLTTAPGSALWDTEFDVSPDGRFVVTSWQQPAAGASKRAVLVRIDTDSGERTVIADDPDADLWNPAIAPDGSAVAFAPRVVLDAREGAANHAVLLALRSRSPVDVAPDWDRWPIIGHVVA